MSILIAEDDRTSARVIELVLKKYGYTYYLAENGSIALQHLIKSPEIKLVLTDIMMPEMDGLQLLAEMKKRRELSLIPVIMCTTKADINTVKSAAKSGCTDYIVKPINPLQLLRKLERILEKETTIIMEYRNLVSKTPIDRHTYAEITKIFGTRLLEKSELLAKHISSQEPLPPGTLTDFSKNCEEIGALRLHALLTEAQELLNSTSSSNALTGELKLIHREMQMLQYYLP